MGITIELPDPDAWSEARRRWTLLVDACKVGTRLVQIFNLDLNSDAIFLILLYVREPTISTYKTEKLRKHGYFNLCR